MVMKDSTNHQEALLTQGFTVLGSFPSLVRK